MIELLTHGGEHHEIGDGGRLMMTMVTDSPLRSLELTPGSALPREIRAWRRLCIVKHDDSSSLISFHLEHEYMELELRSVEVQGAHKDRAHAPGGWPRPPPLWPGCVPPSVDSFANIFYLFQN